MTILTTPQYGQFTSIYQCFDDRTHGPLHFTNVGQERNSHSCIYIYMKLYEYIGYNIVQQYDSLAPYNPFPLI